MISVPAAAVRNIRSAAVRANKEGKCVMYTEIKKTLEELSGRVADLRVSL
jgi:hypothetical protein